jgi:hypothetical protein
MKQNNIVPGSSDSNDKSVVENSDFAKNVKNDTIINQKPKKNIVFITLLIIVFLLILSGTVWAIISFDSKSNTKPDSTDGQGTASSQTQSAAAVNVQTYVTYSYQDPEAEMEALKLLIPKGWQAEGSVTWSPKVFLPAVTNFRFYNPSGSEEFNLLPTQDFVWTNNQLTQSMYPAGSMYFNTLVEAPVSLHQAFTDKIIPSFRKNISDLKIISESSVPELAEIAKGTPVDGVNASAEAGKIRIEYQENGKTMEEEIYAAVDQFVVNYPGSALTEAYDINNWYIDYIFSFKAEKGKLDTNSKLFQTMLYSVQVNPGWYAKIANVKEELAKQTMDQIKAIGRMGSMIAQAASDMRDDQMQAWEYRQQSQDKIAENFSDYTLGIDRYNDPISGKEVELPSGYGNAWSNSSGEYIVSDSPSYNPNIDSNLNWQSMEIAK